MERVKSDPGAPGRATRFVNGLIFTAGRGFVPGGFSVADGRFGEVFFDRREGGTDLGGALVIPGLVDIHVHGAAGADFSDGDPAGLERMAAWLARNGVTSFAPTSMSLPCERLSTAFRAAARLAEALPKGCARPVGIHMEGPFFAEARKGAQNGAWLRPPELEAFRALYADSGGLLSIVDLAPELEGAIPFTEGAKGCCAVSVAHTDASYEQARAAFEAGASHLTHLYNAMPPIRHRSPGVIGAASEDGRVTAELICDGVHVHPSAVRMAFKLFPGRICLVSDALRCCGMPEGEYELGGQRVFLRGGAAYLADGTLAGAASSLFDDLRNAVAFGIPREEAILAATLNPARAIGRADEIGSIEPGKRADFVLCGGDLERRAVYLGGERL